MSLIFKKAVTDGWKSLFHSKMTFTQFKKLGTAQFLSKWANLPTNSFKWPFKLSFEMNLKSGYSYFWPQQSQNQQKLSNIGLDCEDLLLR